MGENEKWLCKARMGALLLPFWWWGCAFLILLVHRKPGHQVCCCCSRELLALGGESVALSAGKCWVVTHRWVCGALCKFSERGRVSWGTTKAWFSRIWFLITFFFSPRKQNSFGFLKLVVSQWYSRDSTCDHLCNFMLFHFCVPCLQTPLLGAGTGGSCCLLQRPGGAGALLCASCTLWQSQPQWRSAEILLNQAYAVVPSIMLWHECNFLCKVGQCSEERFYWLKKHRLLWELV